MFGRKNWQPAEATIVLVRVKRVSSDGQPPTREWAADVRTADGSVFRAKLDEPRWTVDFWPPDARQVVAVQHDPKTGAVRFDMSDPRLSVKARERAEKARFEAALNEDPPTH